MHDVNNFVNVRDGVVDTDFHRAAPVKTGTNEQMLNIVGDSAYLNTSKVASCLPSPPRLSATVLGCAARAELDMGVVAAFGIVELVQLQKPKTKKCSW